MRTNPRYLRLVLLLTIFALIAGVYTFATPPFEASDELWHFGVVQHIAEEGTLPQQTMRASPLLRTFCIPSCGRLVVINTEWEQEGSQPPLYYWLVASLITPINRSDFDTLRQPNPHALAGIPGAVGNKNLVLHTTPIPPLQGTALAAYLGRGFGIALGLITISAVYASARLLMPQHPGVAWLAAGITAFNPMFLFISASVNNDNLVTALNSLIIWQMLIMLRDGFRLRRSVVIAVLIAFASLSKLSGNVLVPVVALSACIVAWQRRDLRGLVGIGFSMAGVWIVVAGWWYLRNIVLYGELFGTSTMVAVAGARENGFTLATLLSEFQGFRFAYWGLFGAVNIQTFRWFYDLMDIFTVTVLVGLIGFAVRQRRNPDIMLPFMLFALLIVIGIASIIVWTAQTYASQGRLLFPFVGATSLLLAVGLWQIGTLLRGLWVIPRISSILSHSAFTVIAGFALTVPIVSIAPQYRAPQPLDTLPPSARPVYARFGNVALVGYETPDGRYQAGDTIPVTVYWQVLAPSDRNNSLWLHAVAPDGRVLGKVDSYPGGGTLWTTTWGAGAIYRDDYAITINQPVQERFAMRVQVGWWHYPSGEGISAIDASGSILDSVMLNSGVWINSGLAQRPALETDFVEFGSAFRLWGYTLNGNHITLFWETLTAQTTDYTVFVQVLDAAGTIVGQGDAPPSVPTRYWTAGEQFVTEHVLSYAQSLTNETAFRMIIGWYDPVSFARLAAQTGDAYPLFTDFSPSPAP